MPQNLTNRDSQVVRQEELDRMLAEYDGSYRLGRLAIQYGYWSTLNVEEKADEALTAAREFLPPKYGAAQVFITEQFKVAEGQGRRGAEALLIAGLVQYRDYDHTEEEDDAT